MRKLAVVLLLLLTMSCVAFADEESDATEQQTIDINKVEMTLSDTVYYKTGLPIEPVPDVTYEGEPLSEDTYTLEYADNIDVGTASVTAVFENGTKSVFFEIVPAKPDKAAITSVTSKKPKVIVKWEKVTCTGYQLQVSLDSNFADCREFKPTGTTKKIGKLKNKKTYYFRVRAYNTENGKTTYGSWSKESSVVHTTGVVGNKYSLNGEYVKDKTIKLGKHYYYYNKSGIRCGCSKTMWKKVRNSSSGTKYLIAIDCTKNRLCVYKGSKGKWKLRNYWMCSTGAKSSPTIKGSFKAAGKVSHFGEAKGYSVWYATRIKYEYYIHSVLYKPYSKTAYIDKRLGKNISHGCVRLKLKNAKWIYNNCGNGTRIITF